MLRIAFVANEPPPYRVPIFNRIAQAPGVAFQVIFCCRREPNRLWNLPPMEFDHVFLRERIKTVNGRYIHNNPDVVSALRRFDPDLVITNGFNPTHLYAFGFALMKGLLFVPMTDGTYASEIGLSRLHKTVRRFVYGRANAFICASLGGKKLYESYGIAPERCFRSHLCIDNDAFRAAPGGAQKRFDFIFSGRIEPAKNPLFALEVAIEAAKRMNRKTSVLFVGSGSQEQRVKEEAALHPELVRAEFSGFAAQEALPALYQSASVFLFPTAADVWGIVANEACAAGLPVIVSPHSGAAGEIILDGENGFVCELDVRSWADRAARLLTQPDLYRRFSERGNAIVSDYTFNHAAAGILDACRFAAGEKKGLMLPTCADS
jgi:glycosyltransferase involved in cell wall biosynthesis